MRKFASKRPALSALLQTNNSEEICKDDKCWQTTEINDIHEINKKLDRLGYKIHHYFGIHKSAGNECRFILATSCQNHEVMIGVNVVHEDCIIIEETPNKIAPGALCNNFIGFNFSPNAVNQSMKVCIFSHFGIDMLGVSYKDADEEEEEREKAKEKHDPSEILTAKKIEIANFALANPVRDVPKLGKKNKFFQALPFVRIENLTDDVNTNNIYKFVNEDCNTIIFKNVLKNSDNSKILASSGPFFTLAPSNYAFESMGLILDEDSDMITESGINNAELKDIELNDKIKAIPKETLNEIIYRHIFLGWFSNDFTGSMTNLLGESFTFVNGQVVRTNLDDTKDASPSVSYNLINLKKSNGTVSIIDELLEPQLKSSQSKGVLTKKFNVNGEGLVSDIDIAELTYKLWNKQNKYDITSRESMRDQANIILQKLDEHERDVEILEDTGLQLLALDERLREIIHSSEVKSDGNNIVLRLSAGNIDISDSITLKLQIWQLSKKYEVHINQSTQLNALEKLLQPITKDIRDI